MRPLLLTLCLSIIAICSEKSYADSSIGLDLNVITDATPYIPDSLPSPPQRHHDWKTLLKGRRLNIADTTVTYPKFIEFCLDIYRWLELNFNTYDPKYVSGTGKHGKIRLMSDNWLDSYAFHAENTPAMLITGGMHTSIGLQANYSVLSASYSVDPDALKSNKPSHHKKMGFSFTCARLWVDAYLWKNSESAYITQYGEFDYQHRLHEKFEGIQFRAYGISALYFFDYKKFSFAAAYNLSSYQLKSAGTFALGFMGTFYKTTFDFTKLPKSITTTRPYPSDGYRLDYNSINIMGGYSFNWVINRHLLANISLFPAIGITKSYESSSAGRRTLFSLAGRGALALSYCHRSFFISCTANLNGNFFQADNTNFVSGIFNPQISTGIRF